MTNGPSWRVGRGGAPVLRGWRMRARIVLAAADGGTNTELADRLGLRSQHGAASGATGSSRSRCDGLLDEPRPGRPRVVGDEQIEALITATLETTPPDATHWSTRSMAEHLGLSQSMVSRVWRAFGLAPHKQDSWKLSKDPLFVAKVRDVVGLYLDPPERALVLCVDEKTQIQALNRTAAGVPDAARHPGAGQPRLRPPRHLEPVRRAGSGHRQGHRLAARPPPRHRSSWRS